MVKNLPASSGDIGDTGSVPGSGRPPGGGRGNPLQYSRLENPRDRGAWRASAHRVSKGQTQLKRVSMHAHMKGISKSDAVYWVPVSCQEPSLTINRNYFGS